MKIDRLLGILTILLQNDQVTAPQLAEKFEVSRRTIGRDIDTLCQGGIPIVTRQGMGGGISIVEGFKLDKSILTKNELSNIIIALKGIRSISDQSPIERTLDKLGANTEAVVSMREPIIIDLGSHEETKLTEKIEQIKTAINEVKTIKFKYYYDKGISKRKIEPYFVVFQWNAWYVFGFCLLRKDWRLFKLMRLWDLECPDENYTIRDIPPQERDFNSHYLEMIKLVALFDVSERYKLIETYGLDSYKETEEGLLFEMGFMNKVFLMNWLLGFGSKVKVLEPVDVIEELKREAKKVLGRYS